LDLAEISGEWIDFQLFKAIKQTDKNVGCALDSAQKWYFRPFHSNKQKNGILPKKIGG